LFSAEPEISWMPQIRGWAGGLMMPSDTDDQVLCKVGQTDGHNNPDHAMRRLNAKLEQFGNTWHLISTPQWIHRVCDGPA